AEQRPEALEVGLAGPGGEAVAGGTALDPIAAEEPPQPRDLGVEQALRAFGRSLAPQAVDEPVARDDLVRVQEQKRLQRALLRPAKGHRPAVNPDLDRAEHRELHRLSYAFCKPFSTFLRQRGSSIGSSIQPEEVRDDASYPSARGRSPGGRGPLGRAGTSRSRPAASACSSPRSAATPAASGPPPSRAPGRAPAEPFT